MSFGRRGPTAAVAARRATRRSPAIFLAVGVMVGAGSVAVPGPAAPVAAAGTTFVVTSSADDGPGTLRDAIGRAESSPGHDVIAFAIPGAGPHTIRLTRSLELIDDPAGMTVDGYTQPGARRNRLDHGSDADLRIELRGLGPNAFDGLDFRSGGNVVAGLALYDFNRHVRFFGSGSVGNEVVGSFVGTDAAGTFRAASRVVAANGIHIERGASANRVGRPGNANRNVISGSADRGVGMFDPGTENNVVQNNVIGLAPDGRLGPGSRGRTPLPNRNHGVDINFGASRNTVGGFGAGEGNVISGNGRTGAEVSHNRTDRATVENRVVGNLIGTTADGADATGATANGEYGIYFEGKDLCLSTCPPDITRNLATNNVVVGSRSNVVVSKGAFDNTISGNRIGVLWNGSPPSSYPSTGRTQHGVSIEAGAFDNTVSRNIIAFVERGIHATPKDSQCPLPGEPNGPECRAAVWPVAGNTFTENSIGDTGLQAIELRRASGSGYVDGPGAGPDVNGGIAAPSIVGATSDLVVVETCPGCRVEVFETPVPSSGFFLEYGRAKRFVGAASADAGGAAVLVLRSQERDPLVVRAGASVTATVTDGSGNTSEVSRRVEVAAGSVPPPAGPPPPSEPPPVGGASTARDPAERCAISPSC